MSEIKVDVVSPYTGTSMTVGESGDTVTCSGTAVGFGGGKVLQVVSTTKTDTATTTGTTWVDISGLSVTTGALAATSSKVLVTITGSGNGSPAADFAALRVLRGSTVIGVGDADGSRTQIGSTMYENNASAMDKFCFQILDSPSSTSAQTYKVQWRLNSDASATIYLNRTSGDDSSTGMRSISTITATEISA